MRKIAPLIFTFVYTNSPTSEACARNAYRRLLAIAERNLIAKGLIGNDIVSSDKVLVDTNNNKTYSEPDDGRIFDNKRSGGQVEGFQRDNCTNDTQRSDSSGEGGNCLASKQSLYNKSIQPSEPK